MFEGCSRLPDIQVDPLNPVYSSLDGVLLNKNQTLLIQYPAGKPGGQYTVPNSVTDIGYGAFHWCRNLTNILIGNSVSTIGSFAFGNCVNLTSLSIPRNVTYIGTYAFDWCSSLTSISIPDSITSIPDGAFFYCGSLKTVTIPSSVRDIAVAGFYYCSNLREIYFKGNAPSLGPNVFDGDGATIYYLPGTTGWAPTFGGLPTMLWQPVLQADDASFGVRTNSFGFTIDWASGMVVVVEACTNLINPAWFPIETNALNTDLLYFSDPQWTNFPARFYRIRWP